MDIENIVINLVSPDRRDSKNSLRAFARLDAVAGQYRFVIRDIRVVSTERSGLLIAMPSRTVDFHCDFCHASNVWNACYCNRCGGALTPKPLFRNARNNMEIKSYDSVFPANPETRKLISDAVLDEYEHQIKCTRGD